MLPVYYPPTGFNFSVSIFSQLPLPNPTNLLDASFQEVSGLDAEFEFEEVMEGGENRYVHRLPKSVRYNNLLLKRGIVTVGSVLSAWFEQTLHSGLAKPIETLNLQIMLLNEDSVPIVTWMAHNAYPAKWVTGPLNSQENKIAIETLELAFSYIERGNSANLAAAAAAVKATKIMV